MRVTLNGEPRELPDGISVDDLLAEMKLAQRRLAVEINMEILSKDSYPTRTIAPGDVIEIVHFIGGG